MRQNEGGRRIGGANLSAISVWPGAGLELCQNHLFDFCGRGARIIAHLCDLFAHFFQIGVDIEVVRFGTPIFANHKNIGADSYAARNVF